MTSRYWAFLLQWSRIAINTAVFLLAAHYLSLSEIGAFATIFAPIKLAQGLHKVGIVEVVLIKKPTTIRLNALFGFSIVASAIFTIAFYVFAFIVDLAWSLCALGFIPAILGFSSLSEGLLRKRMQFRSMAIRTIFSQSLAGLVTLFLILNGQGAEALVTFAVVNVALSAIISVSLAGWWPNTRTVPKHWFLTSKPVLKITGRDALNSGILPLAQIGIGLRFGLVEAGAFQIATRMLGMIDALTLSPLRLYALPQLARIANSEHFKHQTLKTFELSTALACWSVFGFAAAGSDLLVLLIGQENASASVPIFTALLPLSFFAAVTMPFAQSLSARGELGFILKRAVVLMLSSICFALPASNYFAITVCIALTLAGLSTLCWFLRSALPRLELPYSTLLGALLPITVGASMWTLLWGLNLELFPAIVVGSTFYLAFLVPSNFGNRRLLKL